MRLDVALVERGLVETRARAAALILAGQVLVNGQKVEKAGAAVRGGDAIALLARDKYVSRGGVKLEGALADLGVRVEGRICADVGSSTGGFTDCLLQHGAARVYAIDVSPEQMDWKLRQDARVKQIECNARNLNEAALPEPAEVVTIDLSFISTAKVLGAVAAIAGTGAEFLILVKPQFELERGDVGSGGIVGDAALHQRAIERVEAAARECGLEVLGCVPSRLTGAEGNQEFFLHARKV